MTEARIRVTAEYSTPDQFPTAAAPGALDGTLDVVFGIDDLPLLPDFGGLIVFWKAPATAAIRLGLRVELGGTAGVALARVAVLADEDPAAAALTARVNFPGPFRRPTPPLAVALTTITLGGDATHAEMGITGRFSLDALAVPPIPGGPHVNTMFFGIAALDGDGELTLRFDRGGGGLTATIASLDCRFDADTELTLPFGSLQLERCGATIDFATLGNSAIDLSIRPGAGGPPAIALPSGFRLEDFGDLERATFRVDAGAVMSCDVEWTDAAIAVGAGDIHCDRLALQLAVGPGTIDATGTLTGAGVRLGTASFDLTSASVQLAWHDHLTHLAFTGAGRFTDVATLFPLSTAFPYPVAGPTGIELMAACDRTAAGDFDVDIRASVEGDSFRKLPMVPEQFQPDIRRGRLTLSTGLSVAAAAGPVTVTTAVVTVTLGLDIVGLPVKLPGPAADFIKIRKPEGMDPDLLHVEVSGSLGYFTDALAGTLSMSLGGVWIDIDLPGLGQPEPPISFTLPEISIGFSSTTDADGTTHQGCELRASGAFTLRPIHPPPTIPIAPHLERFLEGVSDVSGVGTLTVAMNDRDAHLTLDCGLEGAGIETDVVALLEAISRGAATSAAGSTRRALGDTTVRFALKTITLKVDSPTGAASQEIASVALKIAFGFGPMADAELEVRLSDRAFTLYLDGVRIPLVVPRFPFTAQDVIDIAETPNAADDLAVETANAAKWSTTLAALVQEETSARQLVEATAATVDELGDALRHQPLTGEQRAQTQRALATARDILQTAQADLFTSTVRRGFIEQMKQVRDRLRTSSGKALYRKWVEVLASIIEGSTGLPSFLLDQPLWPTGKCDIVFDRAGLVVPFADLRSTRSRGRCSLESFWLSASLPACRAIPASMPRHRTGGQAWGRGRWVRRAKSALPSG